LILPAHLAHKSKSSGFNLYEQFHAWQTRLRIRIDNAIDRWYSPVIHWVIGHRYLTCALSVGAFLMILGYTFSGRIDFTFRPSIETPFVQAEIEMPAGTPTKRTREVAFLIEEAARKTDR
jgi:multidrug efflux pump subunit AcrB